MDEGRWWNPDRSGYLHSFGMGDFVGGQEPNWGHTDACPICGGIKRKAARTCITCSPRKKVNRDEVTMDRHRRWSAMLELGWTNEELIELRPHLLTWEQIEALQKGEHR